MATRRRKTALEEEKMTPATLQRVIDLLNPSDPNTKPITKKLACELLGMTYNVTRLGQVLDDFVAKQARDRKMRASKRGKPASQDEVVYAITEYIGGDNIDSISKSMYRSATFVKDLLVKHDVPIRTSSNSYFSPPLLPEGAIRDRFSVGEVVYSSRYDSTARIEKEQFSEVHGWTYRLWLLAEKWQQYAWQEATELASLEHLRKLGVRV
jgi:hypothetical protein